MFCIEVYGSLQAILIITAYNWINKTTLLWRHLTGLTDSDCTSISVNRSLFKICFSNASPLASNSWHWTKFHHQPSQLLVFIFFNCEDQTSSPLQEIVQVDLERVEYWYLYKYVWTYMFRILLALELILVYFMFDK